MPTLAVRRHLIAANTIFHWDVFDSSQTETFPTGSTNGDKHRSIRWETGGLYAATRKVYFRKVVRFVQNSPGRFFNFHNQPADAPDGYVQTGLDGTYTSGVSAFAFDWYEGQTYALPGGGTIDGVVVVFQPQERGPTKGSAHGTRKHWQLMSEAEAQTARSAGTFVTFVGEATMNFSNGTPQGAFKCWVKGEANPRVNITSVNPVWLNQGIYTVWEGAYDSSVFDAAVQVDHVASQFGTSIANCLADTPAFYTQWGGTQIDTSDNINSSSQVGTYNTDNIVVPADWGGSGEGLPENTGGWTTAVQWTVSAPGSARIRHKKLLGV